MKTLIKITLLLLALSSIQLFAQYSIDKDIVEPPMAVLTPSQQPGGRMITSIAENGQYLRVLIIFVEFKDDNWNTSWSEWSKNSPPYGWMNTNIIDQNVSQNSTNQNLTHYYTTMSLGHYKVIGQTYHWVTSNTRAEYINWGWKRGDINKQILQNMDNFIDFSIYDKWNKIDEYNHAWGSDGEVDMIWMVYRNISKDLPDPGYSAWQLDFANRQWDPQNQTWIYYIWSGEASLGGNDVLWVDYGTRTIDLRGYHQPLVSGVTIMEGYNGFGHVKNVLIHEFGHHLLGGNEAHASVGGLWAMMGGYGARSQMANSWERHRLGWINPMQYNYNPLLPVPLQDYITTGQALRILIPNSSPEKYYYIENHQRISPFDNIDLTSDGKGIYVLYQSGSFESDLSFLNAEGRSIWTKDHCATHPNGVTVPVFVEGLQSPTGKFDTEAITHISCTTGNNALSPIEAYVDPITGQDVFQPLFRGDNRDMLRPNYVDVFNPVSNPAVVGISFQVISENNQLKIIQKVETGTTYDTPPSKPQNLTVNASANYHPYLTWDANLEPDMISGGSYIVEKYAYSEQGWTYLAQTSNTYYEDLTESYCPPGQGCYSNSHAIRYRVKAKDSQNKVSVPSDSVITIVEGNAVEKEPADGLNDNTNNIIAQNYPNPFNPVTNINYSIKQNSFVSIKLFDVLGNEVAVLINEEKPAGRYNVNFNAANLPSGIYFYKIQAGSFVETKKMILIK